MSDKDWDKLMAQVDKQIESVGDQPSAPEVRKAPAPDGSRVTPGKSAKAESREVAASWPAILRLALSVVLGVGVLFWPYEHRCGAALAGYLAVVAVVAGSGVWSAVWTWRHRTARAHVLSLLLVTWGLALAGAEVLPRTGYAQQQLPWACTE